MKRTHQKKKHFALRLPENYLSYSHFTLISTASVPQKHLGSAKL